jgi:ribosomal protein S7
VGAERHAQNMASKSGFNSFFNDNKLCIMMNNRQDFLKSLKKLDLIKVDPVYNSYLYLKFINKLLNCGRKHKLELILNKVFINISYSLKVPFIFLIVSLFRHSFLPLDFVKKKKGRRVYLVPVPVKFSRLYTVVFNHIALNFKKKKSSISKIATFAAFFYQNLFGKTNTFIAKRRMLIKQVIDNRAFKHFR